jgi:hypothetical protein
MMAPLAGAEGDPGAPTINVKERRRRGPRWVLPEIQERPPSTRRNVDVSSEAPKGAPVSISNPMGVL